MVKSLSFLHLCLVFARRHACMMSEVFSEERRVREVHIIRHFLDGHGRIFQQGLCFQNHIVVNPLSGCLSTDFLDDCREMFRTQEQSFGIEIHSTLFPVVLTYQSDKLLEKYFFPFQRLCRFGLKFRTMTIKNRA